MSSEKRGRAGGSGYEAVEASFDELGSSKRTRGIGRKIASSNHMTPNDRHPHGNQKSYRPLP